MIEQLDRLTHAVNAVLVKVNKLDRLLAAYLQLENAVSSIHTAKSFIPSADWYGVMEAMDNLRCVKEDVARAGVAEAISPEPGAVTGDGRGSDAVPPDQAERTLQTMAQAVRGRRGQRDS